MHTTHLQEAGFFRLSNARENLGVEKKNFCLSISSLASTFSLNKISVYTFKGIGLCPLK